MIERLNIENFKGFKEYIIDFDRITLLVGGNNSGKTTIFHALQTVFWCFEKTADLSRGSEVTLTKTQVPEIGAFPYFDSRDIFYRQKLRTGKKPTRIKFEIKFLDFDEFRFDIYPAFSRNLLVDGHEKRLSRDEYDTILTSLRPVFVPSTIGITVKEELYRTISQDRLISEGRQNEVLRNQIYRLTKNPQEWEKFVNIISPIFKLQGLDVPFDENRDEWLSVLYSEDDCSFDCISAGSGFLQLLNLLVFLFLHESRIALLDEPDSHMHTDLQQISFNLLKKLSQSRNIQLLIATHSPTFIDSAGLESVLVIDKNLNRPLKAQNIEELIPMLSDQGISLPPAKIIETLKSRRVMFVENNHADYEDFFKILGQKYDAGYLSKTRGLMVFETEGATKKWPFDAISTFETLLGVPIKYLYVSDRDFATDEQIRENRSRVTDTDAKIIHFLVRRNRESYLCEPKILTRLLYNRWNQRYPNQDYPDDLKETAINQFFVNCARDAEVDVQTTFLMEQEQYLRGNAEERERKTRKVTQYFKENYSDIIASGQIPYKLFDSKATLRKFRKKISDDHRFSFNDKEILSFFEQEDIPEEICAIISDLIQISEN